MIHKFFVTQENLSRDIIVRINQRFFCMDVRSRKFYILAAREVNYFKTVAELKKNVGKS